MILEMIYFGLFVLILFLIYRFTISIITRILQKKTISMEFLNGFKLVLKIIFIFLFTIGFFTLIQIPLEFLVSISSISGIIVGFASTEVMSQIVSGIYLITSHPFGVNHLVDIQGTTGIVLEIGVNYTSIQKFDGTIVRIPNKKIMDVQIRNYTISIKNEIEKIKKELEITNIAQEDLKKDANLHSKFKDKLGNLIEFVNVPEITRYTFLMTSEFSIPPKQLFEKLTQTLEKFKDIYHYAPTFSILSFGWRVSIEIQVYCTNPCIIQVNHPKFLTEIAQSLYGGN